MENTEKIPVYVMAVYIPSGQSLYRLPVSQTLAARYKVIPYRIMTLSDDKIYIDRITDIRREASTKVGGLGDRYTCLATLDEIQREIFLYKDGDEWYMEVEFADSNESERQEQPVRRRS
jgi:hypothetical protein